MLSPSDTTMHDPYDPYDPYYPYPYEPWDDYDDPQNPQDPWWWGQNPHLDDELPWSSVTIKSIGEETGLITTEKEHHLTSGDLLILGAEVCEGLSSYFVEAEDELAFASESRERGHFFVQVDSAVTFYVCADAIDGRRMAVRLNEELALLGCRFYKVRSTDFEDFSAVLHYLSGLGERLRHQCRRYVSFCNSNCVGECVNANWCCYSFGWGKSNEGFVASYCEPDGSSGHQAETRLSVHSPVPVGWHFDETMLSTLHRVQAAKLCQISTKLSIATSLRPPVAALCVDAARKVLAVQVKRLQQPCGKKLWSNFEDGTGKWTLCGLPRITEDQERQLWSVDALLCRMTNALLMEWVLGLFFPTEEAKTLSQQFCMYCVPSACLDLQSEEAKYTLDLTCSLASYARLMQSPDSLAILGRLDHGTTIKAVRTLQHPRWLKRTDGPGWVRMREPRWGWAAPGWAQRI